MALKLVTVPAEEPISLTEAKEHLREISTAQDTLISTLIVGTRAQVETITRRALITQTWDLYLDAFPASGKAIEIPLSPMASVTSITYVDGDGVTQTWDSSKYTVNAVAEPGQIVPAYNESYPTTRNVPNAVTVRFVAGYGAAADVPAAIKMAMKLLVGHYYVHRESTLIAQGFIMAEVPQGVNFLLWPYRVFKFS